MLTGTNMCQVSLDYTNATRNPSELTASAGYVLCSWVKVKESIHMHIQINHTHTCVPHACILVCFVYLCVWVCPKWVWSHTHLPQSFEKEGNLLNKMLLLCIYGAILLNADVLG